MDKTSPSETQEHEPPPGWECHYLLDRHQQATLALIDVLDSALPVTRDRDSLETAVQETGLGKVSRPVMVQVFKFMRGYFDEHGELQHDAFMDGLFQNFIEEDWLLPVVTGFMDMFKRRKREPVLLGSLLISAVASFESFISGVFDMYYTLRPEALRAIPRDQEKEFSLAELQAMTSLDEAVEIAVSRRVDSLMFGGNLLNWSKFFKESLKVDIPDLADDWLALREIFERRHVLAHQGGVPGTRYANFVRKELRQDFDEARSIQPTEEYVRGAIESLYSFAVLVGTHISEKLEPDGEYRIGDLHDACYEALTHRQYKAALRLSRKSIPLADSDSSRWVFRINEALSLKLLGRIDEARAIAATWDMSAAAPLYLMGRAAILSDLDTVFSLLPTVLESDGVDRGSILEWPLLAEAIDDERMEPIRKKVQVALGIAMMQGLRFNEATGKVHRPDCHFASGDATVGPDPEHWPDGATPCGHCLKPLPA